jgi:hypothetical protein
MWAKIELAREEMTPPGLRPLWKRPHSNEYVSIEAAASEEIRSKGFYTSQNGRRVFDLVALMAGLSQGLNAKRLRQLWTSGIFDEITHDILIEQHLDAFSSESKSQLARRDLSNKLKVNFTQNPTYFQFFKTFLAEAGIYNWKTPTERSALISEAVGRLEISREGASALFRAESYFAPATSKAQSVDEIGWLYSGRDVQLAISSLRKEDIRMHLPRALKYVASELTALPDNAETANCKPTFEDTLRFFFWQGCDVGLAGQAVATLIEVTGAELIYRYIQADQRYRSKAGFPDLLLWNDEDVHFVDVKGPGDQLQDSQKSYSAAVLNTIGYSVEVCKVLPLSSIRTSIAKEPQPSKARHEAALNIDQVIRSTDKKALKKKYKFSVPEDLLLKVYYKEATAAAREIDITVAVEILELARIFAYEHRLTFYKDKYAQYLHVSGWRGDYRSLLWEMTITDQKNNQNANIGNFIAELSQMNYSLGKIHKKQGESTKHLQSEIGWSAFGLLSAHYSSFSDKLNWEYVRGHPIFGGGRSEAEIDEQHIKGIQNNLEFYKLRVQKSIKSANIKFPVGLYVKFLDQDICSKKNLSWLAAHAMDESKRRQSENSVNSAIARNFEIPKDALCFAREVEKACEKFQDFVLRYGAHTN